MNNAKSTILMIGGTISSVMFLLGGKDPVFLAAAIILITMGFANFFNKKN